MDYIEAPYVLYPEENYFPLDFYTGQRAIRCYTQFMKRQELLDPDSPESLVRLQQSLKFVSDFCLENDLTLDDYVLNKETPLPCYVEHLKNHKINFNTLHALSIPIYSIESDMLDFIVGDFSNIYQRTKQQFYHSKKMKKFGEKAKLVIETKLKNKKQEEKIK